MNSINEERRDTSPAAQSDDPVPAEGKGAAKGAVAGAAIGAASGAFAGPLGAAAGAVAGAVLGGAGGAGAAGGKAEHAESGSKSLGEHPDTFDNAAEARGERRSKP